MSEQEKREDGFYFVTPLDGQETVAKWEYGLWWLPINEVHREDGEVTVGPRVQRDSEVVRQRDELLSDLKRIQVFADEYEVRSTSREIGHLIARIEAEKLGVKP